MVINSKHYLCVKKKTTVNTIFFGIKGRNVLKSAKNIRWQLH